MLQKASRPLAAAAAVTMLALFIFCSASAAEGARAGLETCASVIIPSLFPLFIVTSFLSALGVPAMLGRALSPLTSRLFGVSGQGGCAFIIGILGGYPLGASVVAQMYCDGSVDKKQAERLLGFCNNSGPAFIIGAVGVGVFKSTKIGMLLYISHVAAAALCGVLLRGPRSGAGHAAAPVRLQAVSAAEALTSAVTKSASSMLSICGFVVFFSVLIRSLDYFGLFSLAAGRIAASTGLELSWARSLLYGALEIGNGIAAMGALSAEPVNIALAAFILGWGGVSVHFQTLAVLSPCGEISLSRYFLGKLLHAFLSAAVALALSALF